jgi:TolA-binding protein
LCLLILLLPFSSISQDQADIQLAHEYLIKGDKQKALELFRELVRKPQNAGLVHSNYVNTLLDLAQYSEAQDYIKKSIKREPENMLYKLDAGLIMVRSGDVQKADKYFREMIADYRTNTGLIKSMSDYFMGRSLFDYAIISLVESREALGIPAMYCLELATLYRVKGEKDKMTQEYLNYATQNTGNNQYIKNVLQVLLTKPDELETLERLLYREVQLQPEEEVYTDLLIWVMLQQKNFYGAFVQARAYDRRYKTDGDRSMEVGKVALDNKDYQNATAAFNYVIKNYSKGENLLEAQLGYIRSREARIRETYPIRKDSIANLISAYRNFIESNQQQVVALEASRNMANMYAEFLEQPDTAVQQLTKLIANPRTSVSLRSRAKLDLADIYIVKEEPWESALLYAQVEKTQKETSIGYEAKLKNARLSYYRGDFQLAQEHLDILKEATTREIANDALDLSMLIKENIALDSAGLALKEFANVELLLKQNKIAEALAKIQQIKEGTVAITLHSDTAVAFSNYAIKDDCYWLEAKLNLQQSNPQQALVLLEKIITEYPTDILADDAFFMIGEIYERHLGQKEKAMEQYKNLLEQFPGSVYVAEARKRFRQLRGDFKQEEPKS